MLKVTDSISFMLHCWIYLHHCKFIQQKSLFVVVCFASFLYNSKKSFNLWFVNNTYTFKYTVTPKLLILVIINEWSDLGYVLLKWNNKLTCDRNIMPDIDVNISGKH